MGRPRKDHTGETFGWLVAIERSKTHPRKWRFDCHACGSTTYEALVENVRRADSPTCGCRPAAQKIQHGDVFNRLTAQYSKPGDPSRWFFRCECGNIKDFRLRDVMESRQTSCSKACTRLATKGDNTLRVDVSPAGAKEPVWKTLEEMTPKELRDYALSNLFIGGSSVSIAMRAAQLELDPLDALKMYLKTGGL